MRICELETDADGWRKKNLGNKAVKSEEWERGKAAAANGIFAREQVCASCWFSNIVRSYSKTYVSVKYDSQKLQI